MPELLMNNLPGIVLMLIASLIGVIAYRRNNTKQLRDIQQQVNTTYQTLNTAQKEEIAQIKRDLARCSSENKAMRMAFAKLGIVIEIDAEEEILTMIKEESAAKNTTIIQVKIKDGSPHSEEP